MLLIISWVSFLLIISLEGEIVQNYLNFRPLSKWLKIDEYNNKQMGASKSSYPKYLALYYPNFFTNLISCPLCLGSWLSIVLSSIFLTFWQFPIILICSLVVFYLISWLKKITLVR